MTSVRALRRRLAETVEGGIAMALPTIVRRSLRRNLHGVWARGAWSELPTGAVLIANHHSWWDAYLVVLLKLRLAPPVSALMARPQLERFPFFRRHGALDEGELRTAVRRLRRGGLVVVFPEGRLSAAGALGALRPGARWLAERSGVPLVPLAIRVQLRGAQHPEAYLALGEAIDPAALPEGGEAGALGALLSALDHDLAHGDPEAPAEGFERWLRGAQRGDRRAARAAAWWRS